MSLKFTTILRRMAASAFLLVLGAAFAPGALAQKAALKTNLITDALATPTLAIETQVAPKWTAELTGALNAWDFDHGQKKWKHWLVMPELRYWLCDTWAGHFVGAHIFGGEYNVGGIKHLHDFLGTNFSRLADNRYQGWYVGAGLVYGYDWILSRHWNIEAEIGLGWAYTRYDRYPCKKCGTALSKNKAHNYVGPTKAAINIVYLF